jgi:hypothetical protein
MPRRKTVAQLEREIAASLAEDRSITQRSLAEERQAIRVYGSRLGHAHRPALRRALGHARKEEREHARMFARLLRRRR